MHHKTDKAVNRNKLPASTFRSLICRLHQFRIIPMWLNVLLKTYINLQGNAIPPDDWELKHTFTDLTNKINSTLLCTHPLNGLFSRTTWVSEYQKGKISLELNEARDDGILGCSGISWTIRKQSAPRCRPITTSSVNQQCQSTEDKSTENT